MDLLYEDMCAINSKTNSYIDHTIEEIPVFCLNLPRVVYPDSLPRKARISGFAPPRVSLIFLSDEFVRVKVDLDN